MRAKTRRSNSSSTRTRQVCIGIRTAECVHFVPVEVESAVSLFHKVEDARKRDGCREYLSADVDGEPGRGGYLWLTIREDRS